MRKRICLFILFIISWNAVDAQTTITDSIVHNGVMRNYRLFLPNGFIASDHLPLVFNFHGLGSNALEQEAYTGFDAVADTAHVVVCYPNGINNAWNIVNSNSTDIDFVDTLITVLHNQYNINLNRVYSTGLSNGGFLSNLLGCSLSNRIAAIAPVAGTNVPLVQNTCTPSSRVPVLYIHGDADPIVNYYGTAGIVSAADLMNLWTGINHCSLISDTIQVPNISTTDNCTAEKITWHNCDSNVSVVHYRIINGGHTWPGVPFIIGTTNQDFVASSIIWEFFNRHALNTGINEIESSIISNIFPNPVYSNLFLELKNSSGSFLSIFSSDGRLIQAYATNSDNIELNMASLSPGIYFLKVVQNDRTESFRIIKI